MNRIIVMGRLVNDPQIRVTPNGTQFCTFKLAVNRNYQKQSEERKADFFNVSAFGGTADFITKWFGKGRMILIEGEMQTREYTDKNGNPAIWYEIVVSKAYFTGEKNTDNFAPAAEYTPQQTQQALIPAATPEQIAQVVEQAKEYNDEFPF